MDLLTWWCPRRPCHGRLTEGLLNRVHQRLLQLPLGGQLGQGQVVQDLGAVGQLTRLRRRCPQDEMRVGKGQPGGEAGGFALAAVPLDGEVALHDVARPVIVHGAAGVAARWVEVVEEAVDLAEESGPAACGTNASSPGEAAVREVVSGASLEAGAVLELLASDVRVLVEV